MMDLVDMITGRFPASQSGWCHVVVSTEGKYYDTLESFTSAVVRMRDQMADEEVEAERTLMEKLGALLVADR